MFELLIGVAAKSRWSWRRPLARPPTPHGGDGWPDDSARFGRGVALGLVLATLAWGALRLLWRFV